MNPFGIVAPGSFLNPYFGDRTTRTPSPLHRLLQSQLLGGMNPTSHQQNSHHNPHYAEEHHFGRNADDLLDSVPSFRGLNLSTHYPSSEDCQLQHPHSSDPLVVSGHLSRSLDDLSVDVLENSSDSEKGAPYRDSLSPDDVSMIQSEYPRSENVPSHNAHSIVSSSASTTKPRRQTSRNNDVTRTCPTCGKSFGNSSGLAKHRLTHSDERKYLCTVCMKSFKRQDHLSGHMLTHSEKKPFACPVVNCGKSYCDSRSLKRHIDQHESWLIPSQVRLLFNDSAGAEDTNDDTSSVFEAPDSSQNSAEAHKPYVCQVCRRRFRNSPALNGHMRLHGGFLNKKAGDYSAPPSVQSSSRMRHHSAQASIGSPVDIMGLNDPSEENSLQDSFHGGPWNSAQQPVIRTPTPPEPTFQHDMPVEDPLTPHIAVIRHGPSSQNSIKASLPPVSTLASPTNSPTTVNAPFSFFSGHPPPQLAMPASTGSDHFSNRQTSPVVPGSSLTVPVCGKLRRHSDSDSVQPPKKLCTVTDLLRHTINLNMARKTFNGSQTPEADIFSYPPVSLNTSSSDGNLHHPDHFDDLNDVFDTNVSQSHNVIDDWNMQPEMAGESLFSPKDEPETSPVSVQTNSPYSVAGSGTGSSDGQDYPDSPATPTGSIEKKRKHRPGPLNLMIPSQSGMGTQNALLSPPGGGFASRLRSPRLSGDKSSLTPPPYTPPPMLSPSRRGSGLFWNVVNTASSGTTTPHSASRFLLKRSLSSTSTSYDYTSALRASSGDDLLDLKESPFNFSSSAPETDKSPHINCGPQHQAVLPRLQGPETEVAYLNAAPKEDCLWDPKMASHLTGKQVESFVSLASSAAMPKAGRNAELAHHVLYQKGGDIRITIQTLLSNNLLMSLVNSTPGLKNYNYQLSTIWSPDEISHFSQAIQAYEKDFFQVAAQVKSKSVAQCIEFFYYWKKVSPEDYRKCKRLRAKKEIATRSKAAVQEPSIVLPKPVLPEVTSAVGQSSGLVPCPYANCCRSFGTVQALAAHSRKHLERTRGKHLPVVPATLDMCPPPAPVVEDGDVVMALASPEPQPEVLQEAVQELPAASVHTGPAGVVPPEEFPCRICSK
ncbi:hypothetical protein RvY_09483-2 [Ramazzottius varieornatus]|nr:hypothetical protein RvY_09483-2 [Ramazzottius varieornatus]